MKETKTAYDENGKEIVVEGYFVTTEDLSKLIRDFLADNYDGFVSNDVSYLEAKLNNTKPSHLYKLKTTQQDKLKEIRKTLHLRIGEIEKTLDTIREIRDNKECSFKSLQEDMYDCEEVFSARIEELENILNYVESLINDVDSRLC